MIYRWPLDGSQNAIRDIRWPRNLQEMSSTMVCHTRTLHKIGCEFQRLTRKIEQMLRDHVNSLFLHKKTFFLLLNICHMISDRQGLRYDWVCNCALSHWNHKMSPASPNEFWMNCTVKSRLTRLLSFGVIEGKKSLALYALSRYHKDDVTPHDLVIS